MGIYRAGCLPLPSLGGQPLLLLLHAQLLIVLSAEEFPADGHGPFKQPFVPVGELEPLSEAPGERMLAPAVRRDDMGAGVPPPVRMGEVGEDVCGDLPPECGGVRVAAVARGGLCRVPGAGVCPARAVDEAAHGGVGGGRGGGRSAEGPAGHAVRRRRGGGSAGAGEGDRGWRGGARAVGGGRAPSRGRGGAGAVVHAGVSCRGRSVTHGGKHNIVQEMSNRISIASPPGPRYIHGTISYCMKTLF